MSSTHNCKNYTAHGGNETVIGGKLTFLSGAEVAGLVDLLTLPTAANQADSTASTVAAIKDDFNALLTKLKAAGLMTADTPADE